MLVPEEGLWPFQSPPLLLCPYVLLAKHSEQLPHLTLKRIANNFNRRRKVIY